MIKATMVGLTGLVRFSGRTKTSDFWFYALAAVLFSMFVAGIPYLVIFTRAMEVMGRYVVEHPEQATVTTGPGSYSVRISGDGPPEMGRLMASAIHWLGLVPLAGVIFLAAAVTRRLHDRNKAGFWGLMPLPFLTFSLLAFPRLIEGAFVGNGVPDFGLFCLVFLSNALYMAGLIGLIVLLCGRGTPGPNRYGPDPRTPNFPDTK